MLLGNPNIRSNFNLRSQHVASSRDQQSSLAAKAPSYYGENIETHAIEFGSQSFVENSPDMKASPVQTYLQDGSVLVEEGLLYNSS